MATNKDILRFYKKVQKTDHCWEWTGAKKPSGYGNFWLNGKHINAHKFSAIYILGGAGEIVCHKCDNKSCVRPEHLYWGTVETNTLDALERDRYNPWRKGMKICDRNHLMVTENIVSRGNRKRCRECMWMRDLVSRVRRGVLTRQSTIDRLASSGYTLERLLKEFEK